MVWGGHHKGDVASALVTEFIVNSVKAGVPLKAAVSKAHQAVLQAGFNDPSSAGMGATIVALKINSQNYEIVWMGDSRAYLWNGNLRQLTKDHSYIQGLLDAGVISLKEAKHHPKRSVVQRAAGMLGVGNVDADFLMASFNKGEKILLCSDGLTNEVDDEEIAEVLKTNQPEQEVVNKLVKMALDHGGSDNITVMLVGMPN